MTKNTFLFSYPEKDHVVNKWLTEQDDPSLSLRTLIRRYASSHGCTDPTCEDIPVPDRIRGTVKDTAPAKPENAPAPACRKRKTASVPQDELDAYFRSHNAEPVTQAYADAFNAAFGTSFTANNVSKRRSLWRGRCRIEKQPQPERKRPSTKVPAEKRDEYFEAHSAGHVTEAYADAFNREFGTSYTRETIMRARTQWKKKNKTAAGYDEQHVSAYFAAHDNKCIDDKYTEDFNKTFHTAYTKKTIRNKRHNWRIANGIVVPGGPGRPSKKQQAARDLEMALKQYNKTVSENSVPIPALPVPALY